MNLLTMIVGNTSTGKTTSLRNLEGNTFVINTERKELPFISKGLINYMLGPRDATPEVGNRPAIPAMNVTQHMHFILDKVNESPRYHNVVIDSFSAYTDHVLAECKAKYKGYDIWAGYNTAIFDFFNKLKDMKDKFVFVLAHVEYLQDADGNTVVRTKAKGKEWEGKQIVSIY